MSSVSSRNRILQDIRELEANQSHMIQAHPMEDNMFDWHFTIRGPPDTEFEGGIYHGRIILPSDYPLKPPSIIFLTPNGRFQTKTRVCLSISDFHPESWKPVWGVRTILEGIISFFPTPGEGAVGALDCSIEERKRLAKLSANYSCPVCGLVKDLLIEDPANAKQSDQTNISGASNIIDSDVKDAQIDSTKEDKSMNNSNSENYRNAVDLTTSSPVISPSDDSEPTATQSPGLPTTPSLTSDHIKDNYISDISNSTIQSTPDYYKDYPPAGSINNSGVLDKSFSMESRENTNDLDNSKLFSESNINHDGVKKDRLSSQYDRMEKKDGMTHRIIGGQNQINSNDTNNIDDITDNTIDNSDDIPDDGKLNNDPNISDPANNDDCEDGNDFKDINIGKLFEDILTFLIWFFIILILVLITKKMKML